jgi:hydrogenase-4 component E
MTTFIISLYALTLIYFTISERFRTYIWLSGLQGLLLFGVSFFELDAVEPLNLIFIFSETIIFKSVVVPWLLLRIVKRTNDHSVHKNSLPGYYGVVVASGLLLISYLVSYILTNPIIDRIYFTIALFGMFMGILFVISHKKIFSHLIGFLIIENSVFLFSVAIGNEMPMMINTGILLDIFISVLILGTFMTKIGTQIQTLETDTLTKLKD